MATRAYKDIDGCYINSDDVVFDDYTYEKQYNDWFLSPEKYYEQVLKENQYIYNQLVKELQN